MRTGLKTSVKKNQLRFFYLFVTSCFIHTLDKSEILEEE